MVFFAYKKESRMLIRLNVMLNVFRNFLGTEIFRQV